MFAKTWCKSFLNISDYVNHIKDEKTVELDVESDLLKLSSWRLIVISKIVNPAKITIFHTEASFKATMTVNTGRGYVPVDEK